MMGVPSVTLGTSATSSGMLAKLNQIIASVTRCAWNSPFRAMALPF